LGNADINGDPGQSACPGRQGALRARSLVGGAGFGALWEIMGRGKRVGKGGTPGVPKTLGGGIYGELGIEIKLEGNIT